MLIEVGGCTMGRPLVDEPALDHEDQLIKLMEYLRVGLVDDHNDGLVLLPRQIAQVPYDDLGSEGVEA
jgi:hypothetical protein